MKIARKIELATQAVAFIARHDDASVTLRGAALDKVAAFIEAERAAMSQRAATRDAAELEALTGDDSGQTDN